MRADWHGMPIPQCALRGKGAYATTNLYVFARHYHRLFYCRLWVKEMNRQHRLRCVAPLPRRPHPPTNSLAATVYLRLPLARRQPQGRNRRRDRGGAHLRLADGTPRVPHDVAHAPHHPHAEPAVRHGRAARRPVSPAGCPSAPRVARLGRRARAGSPAALSAARAVAKRRARSMLPQFALSAGWGSESESVFRTLMIVIQSVLARLVGSGERVHGWHGRCATARSVKVHGWTGSV